MRHILAVALSALIAAPAFGQSAGTLALTGPSTTPGAPQLTPAAINAAVNAILSAKQDYNAPGLFTTLTAASVALTGNATVGGTLGVTGATTLSGLLTLNAPASIGKGGTRTWSGTQNAIGNAEIWSFTNQTGTTTSGNPVAFHFFGVLSDTVQNPGGHAVSNLRSDLTTGAGFTGARNGLWSNLTIGGTPGDTGGQYSAGVFAAGANAPAAAGGNILYGSNPTSGLNAGATGPWSVVGEEIDVQAVTGTTPTASTGLAIVLVSGHAVRGSTGLDSGLVFGNQSTNPGWKYGIRFCGPSIACPFGADSTLIYGYAGTTTNFASGIDFSNYTFSTAFLKSTGFLVDGSGNATAASYKVASTAGVTCSGSPTASFASIGGIVTHC